MKRKAAAAALLALCACAGDLTSPITAVVITYSQKSQTYVFASRAVTTLTSLRHLEGASGTLKAGGTVRVVNASLQAKSSTVDTLRAQFVTGQPSQVQLEWSVIDGIVYPENFDSLELLSAYFNFETARKSLGDWGLSSKLLPSKPIVSAAKLADDDGVNPLGLGEMYYAPLATFYLPAATSLQTQQLPLALNVGAAAHALAHEAVQELVWAGAPVAAPELQSGTDPDTITARHVARSFTEGIADFVGATVSDDPVWFAHSIQQGAAARGLDQLPRCSSPDMADALITADNVAPYDPYALGTVLAGALWEASDAAQVGVQVVATGVLSSLSDLGKKASAGPLTLATVLDVLVATSDQQVQPHLCGLFYNRFAQVGIKSLPSCTTVTPHEDCQ